MTSRSIFIGLLLSLALLHVQAGDLKGIPCQNEDDCSFLGPSYNCFNGEFCIKSTVAGCLLDKDSGAPSRVCNSNDSEEVIQMGLCRLPKNEEMEIRIYSFDWDSSMFQTWILQILLSELLDVPVSVETGNAHIDFSFYSPEEVRNAGRIFYNQFSSISRSFQYAHIYGDCRLAEKKVLARYETCAHFSPEIRFPIEEVDLITSGHSVQRFEQTGEMVRTRIAEPLEPAGGFGEQGLYIPKFTAQQDPSLISYFGMIGEDNRQKLADTFLRPTRWSDYCELISPSQCEDADSVATRAPMDRTEAGRFFVSGLYTGYFQKTDRNDCERNPSTCTGHVADYPCTLQSPVENQVYHLGLALEGDIDNKRFGYDLSELPEIWHAANATKSNVLLYWTKPTLLSQEYAGTDAEFTKVAFPAPSQACLDARRSMYNNENCLLHKAESFGTAEAVCDDPPVQLQKATSSALYDLLFDGVPEAIQSPAYAVLKAYTLPEMELSRFLEDLNREDDPRRAVCDWVHDNMETLKRFIPPTYPRVQEDVDQTVLMYTSLSLGALSATLVVLTAWKVWLNRKENVIRFAQFEFLALVLLGSLLTAIGAIIGSLPRSDSICMAELWFIYLGYSLALVPQIVKVAAINRLMSAARRYQRLRLNLKNLYGAVTAVSLLVVIYLVLWTILDAPQKQTHYTLTDSLTASGETIVMASYSCGSDNAFWEFIAISWNGLLLISAVVLAIQSRNVVQEFNESHTLGILIYTNFVFLLSRGLTYYFEDILDPSIVLRFRSIIYSLDVIASLAVYFWPKVFLREKKDVDSSSRRGSSLNNSSHSGPVFFSAPPKRPMFTTLPNRPFDRLLTSISNITFHPNEDQSVAEGAIDDNSPASTVSGGDTEGTGVEVSRAAPPNNGNDTYVRKLEMAVIGLEAEVKGLRKRIRGGELNTPSDPPAPNMSFSELDRHSLELDSIQTNHHEDAGSQQARQVDFETPWNNIPAQMSSSSSSEKATPSDQVLSSSSSEKVSSSDQESVVSSAPSLTLTSFYSTSESARDSGAEVCPPQSKVLTSSIIEKSPKLTQAPSVEASKSDLESSLSSMPVLTSYYSTSESGWESEASLSEHVSFASPIVQSPRGKVSSIAPTNTTTVSGGREIEMPVTERLEIPTGAMPPRIPRRRPSLPSEELPGKESILSEASMYSIAEQEEQC
eukprot:CAMPEP_0113633486 /NCGR_PEP_ID=MMETSP0017_2-20120614/17428_1 /TAXON_ID=2856 /ORGANISM="Cylindrotheca closterium" /LENGTH=1188 /DNA_ID=CAMNT_0000544129 /DNA_START=312 /DNA_END=3878 /DNA_ORIENTATION=+ /assembly_acc=CAM_ASM_000147